MYGTSPTEKDQRRLCSTFAHINSLLKRIKPPDDLSDDCNTAFSQIELSFSMFKKVEPGGDQVETQPRQAEPNQPEAQDTAAAERAAQRAKLADQFRHFAAI